MAALEITVTTDVEVYAGAALAFLDGDPCARTILRSTLETVREGVATWSAAPAFWWVTVDGRTEGAAHWTPPFGLAASTMPADAIAPLMASVHARATELAVGLPFVMGPRAIAEALAGEWARTTGGARRLHHRLLLHELTRVIEPRRPAGGPRTATRADLDRLVTWYDAFIAETGGVPLDTRASVTAGVDAGTVELWEDGEPVSLVTRRRAAGGVVRIGPVYTPPEHRGKGYARALTAHSSRRALDAGARHCVLYTDADNPVSNRIYADIGYVVTGEHAEYRLS